MMKPAPYMPPHAPLDMPKQDFRKAPVPRKPFEATRTNPLWRVGLFMPAFGITGLFVYGLWSIFAAKGFTAMEYVLLGLIATTLIWVTLAVSTVALGVAGRARRSVAASDADPLNVALLVPMYNEAPSAVFGNAAAMLADLDRQTGPHQYTLYLLSDTQDANVAAQEEQAITMLQAKAPEGLPVHYRRRAENTDKKVGNLVDWITGWGAAHDAMLVLDADSLMAGRTIARLADAMAADPDAGLIQSYPQLIGADSLFGRMQQFSNVAYGWLLAEGLATWAQSEGNYWGHNAIIRTRAFAEAAGLPYMRGLHGRGLILSHDFVEASLLRRAGWTVRFLPRLSGSFEETPGTLIDHVLRDRRWCRGNMQHLRLLWAKGLHPVSRFHMFQGAAAYLMSPTWFVLLVFWALLGRDAETNVIRYFNEANPLFPNWPPEMTHMNSAVFLVIMYAMLLTPKLAAAGMIVSSRKAVKLYGGRRAFAGAFLQEVFLSIAYAPIMMIQQTRAVLRGIVGGGSGWAPQQRNAQAYPVLTLLKFHWMETGLGMILSIGLTAGLVSWWLFPIVASLALSIPLSALSSMPMSRLARGFQMHSPLTLREPAIVTAARAERSAIAKALSR